MKVLIIDDSADALAVAKARLAHEGYHILCAGGGNEGLEAAVRDRPDLILLDVDMPDMSGFEVCRLLKEDSELCMIPVIFLSGSGGPKEKVKGLNLGAVDYVTKPFDAFELRARVNAALRTKHMQDLLIEHAVIDPLTGLANRRGLMERLAQEWARIQRHGGALSFIMGDVDYFKRVNDIHGHIAGDRMLQAMGGAIAAQCRQSDLPSRYGGDEFAVLVPGEAAPAAAKLAERCRRTVQAIRLKVGEEVLNVTASFGVADAAHASSAEAMIEDADKALYKAKSAGRNCVRELETAPAAVT